MRKIIFISLAVVLLIAIGTYFYLNHDHRKIETEKSAFALTSESLVSAFQTNPTEANQKYLNKTIEISGSVTEQSDSTLTLDPGVFCFFSDPIDFESNQKDVTVKCRCIGYDELFGEVKLDQCSLIK